MCKSDDRKQVTEWKEKKCPEHKMEEEERVKKMGLRCRDDGKRKRMEEWPDVDCRPM